MLPTIARLLLVLLMVDVWSVLSHHHHWLSATTPHFKDIFRGRCYDYEFTKIHSLIPRVPINCSHLYDLFEEAFAYRPSCGLNKNRYNAFMQAASQALPSNKSMFSSGAFELVHRLSNNGRNFVTLEDTLIGHLLDGLNWCGNLTSGIDYISCPPWGTCEGVTSESFWTASSQWFASSARGEVHVLLNGSNPDRRAYVRDSFFGRVELPSMNASLVTKVNVMVVGDLVRTRRETCTTGSLRELRQDILKKGIEFKCQDDPRSVMHLLCSDDPNHDKCQCLYNSAWIQGVKLS